MRFLKLIQLFVLPLCVPESSTTAIPRCNCGDFLHSELKEETLNLEVGGNTTFLISPRPIGSGAYGDIYHAFWQHQGSCVALKMYKESKKAEAEIKMMRFVKKDDHIIQMSGLQRNPTTVIVMELGGMNFDNYFSTKILEGQDYNIKKHEHILSKMILCAARALQQFHKLNQCKQQIIGGKVHYLVYGIHMDVKGTNFVTIKGQDSSMEMNLCKIIDFNSTIITEEEAIEIDKRRIIISMAYLALDIKNNRDHTTIVLTRKVDIYAFGVTIYKFLLSPHNELVEVYPESLDYYGRLGQLSKAIYRGRYQGIWRIARQSPSQEYVWIWACLQENPDDRPTIEEVISILVGM
uniref:Protein kinase domain-containing protein n=1 Tax=Meloidogyne floridensis TaxID=298350 RepID=A0A915P6V9_9BILA